MILHLFGRQLAANDEEDALKVAVAFERAVLETDFIFFAALSDNCKSLSVRNKSNEFLTYSRYEELMDEIYPLTRVEGGFFNRTDFMEILQSHGAQGTFSTPAKGTFVAPLLLSHINLASSAGLLFGQRTKNADVLYETLYYAKNLWDRAREFDDPEVVRKYTYLLLAALKPKTEVYERNEILKKTRNICAFNTYAQTPAQFLHKATHTNADHYLTPGSTSHSIVGLSLMSGGMNALMHKLLVSSEPQFLIFADNIYLYFPVDDLWLSLDGTKMEASHSIVFAKFEIVRCLRQVGCLVSESPDGELVIDNNGVSANLVNFMLLLFPHIAYNTVAVWGKSQIPLFGNPDNKGNIKALRPELFSFSLLGSGVNGTAYFNTALSSLIMATYTKNFALIPSSFTAQPPPYTTSDGEVPLAEHFQTWSENHGVAWKLEQQSVGLAALRHLEILKTDLLGYSTVVFEIMTVEQDVIKIFIPVLDDHRLANALLWNKAEGKASFGKLDPITQRIQKSYLTLAKLRCLYIIGGWYYPGVAESMLLSMIGAIKTFKDGLLSVPDFSMEFDVVKRAIEDMFAAFSGSFGEITETQLHAMLSGTLLPTMQEVISVTTGPSEANAFGTGIIQAWKKGELNDQQLYRAINLSFLAEVNLSDYDMIPEEVINELKGTMDEYLKVAFIVKTIRPDQLVAGTTTETKILKTAFRANPFLQGADNNIRVVLGPATAEKLHQVQQANYKKHLRTKRKELVSLYEGDETLRASFKTMVLEKINDRVQRLLNGPKNPFPLLLVFWDGAIKEKLLSERYRVHYLAKFTKNKLRKKRKGTLKNPLTYDEWKARSSEIMLKANKAVPFAID